MLTWVRPADLGCKNETNVLGAFFLRVQSATPKRNLTQKVKMWLEVSSHVAVQGWADGWGKMLLGRNRGSLCCCAVATVTLLIAHWLSSGAGFLFFIPHWCFQTGYGIPLTFSGPASKTTAAVGVLGKEAVPVNDTFPSAWYPTSCFPARYSSRKQGRQKHLSWDATVPFKSSKGQNLLYIFHPYCLLTLTVPSLATLTMQTPLFPYAGFIAMFLCHPYEPQNFRLLVVEVSCVSDTVCSLHLMEVNSLRALGSLFW